ncbi:MAG: hypothetical protein M3350_09715 [Actinomycetota bacterium]|nr:hypothetical protein [Actinomycetota bacterium]
MWFKKLAAICLISALPAVMAGPASASPSKPPPRAQASAIFIPLVILGTRAAFVAATRVASRQGARVLARRGVGGRARRYMIRSGTRAKAYGRRWFKLAFGSRLARRRTFKRAMQDCSWAGGAVLIFTLSTEKALQACGGAAVLSLKGKQVRVRKRR